jgi:hypothetical protein
MFATPSLAGSLFRIANFCDPDVVMERLEETGRYNDLIDFLYGKKLHRQALELLQRFGKTDSGPLSGPTRTVAYLQNLPPDQIDLVIEFGEWPLRANHELGMEIFVTDTENAETLPRSRVLAFLEKIDITLAIQYLEHVINEWNDMTPDIHQRLLILYLDQLTSNNEQGKWKDKFLTMLKESEQYSPAKMLDRLNREGTLRTITTKQAHTDECQIPTFMKPELSYSAKWASIDRHSRFTFSNWRTTRKQKSE